MHTPTVPQHCQTIDDVIERLYGSISGPPDAPRDWAMMHDLFLPDARLLPLRPTDDRGFVGEPFTVADYEARRNDFFVQNGFYELETHRVSDIRGPLANVHSWFRGRYTFDGEDLVRGVNAIQMVQMHGRWWITAISWFNEFDARAATDSVPTGKERRRNPKA